MQRNLIALYLVKLSKWFTLVMPIIVLFYEEHKLGLQDVFILKSVYSVAAVALEVPSGYLADVWGRKRCIVAGCVLFVGGYLCYSLTSTFAAFLVAEILLGIGQTMINGADSALLYDTTVHHGRENLYLRYEGRITMIGNFAEAVAGIFGGLLAVYLSGTEVPSMGFIGLVLLVAAVILASPVVERRNLMGEQYWITNQRAILMTRDKTFFYMELSDIDDLRVVGGTSAGKSLVLGSCLFEEAKKLLRWRACHPKTDIQSHDETDRALGMVFYCVRGAEGAVKLLRQGRDSEAA